MMAAAGRFLGAWRGCCDGWRGLEGRGAAGPWRGRGPCAAEGVRSEGEDGALGFSGGCGVEMAYRGRGVRVKVGVRDPGVRAVGRAGEDLAGKLGSVSSLRKEGR